MLLNVAKKFSVSRIRSEFCSKHSMYQNILNSDGRHILLFMILISVIIDRGVVETLVMTQRALRMLIKYIGTEQAGKLDPSI